jgi:hypothetical protein
LFIACVISIVVSVENGNVSGKYLRHTLHNLKVDKLHDEFSAICVVSGSGGANDDIISTMGLLLAFPFS